MMAAPSFDTIEAARAQLQISIDSLSAAAGVTARFYSMVKAGKTGISDAKLARLNLALRRFKVGYGIEAGTIAPTAALSACMVLAAFYLKEDPRLALNADPRRRATADPVWMSAARVRRLGWWIANQWFGFSQADLGVASGVSRGAVHEALRDLEWERDIEGGDNRDLDRVMKGIEEIFS